MRELFLTFFYVGKIPFAPGTFGTFAALPFALAILLYMPSSTLFLVGLVLFVVGAREVTAYEKVSGSHDEKKIVIDEVSGVFIAISLAPGVMIPFEAYTTLSLPIFVPLILSVLYFRLFDILKPSLIGRIDREVKGGWGVMGDDVLAGFAAGFASAVTWVAIEKFLL